MRDLLEKLVAADHLTKMELAEEAAALPPDELATAVAELSSIEAQQRITTAIIDKWSEDRGDGDVLPWRDATPTILALRGKLLEKWEADDRAMLSSMQIFRMSYLYSVAILASFARDELYDRVRRTVQDELLKSDVASDAQAVLQRWMPAEE